MESPARTAIHDPALQAKIINRLPLIYGEGASPAEDRPPFVLAASGLATLGKYLFVVQDNANWLAVVSPDRQIVSIPLPRGAGGSRIFSKGRHNNDDKLDLEACVVMQGPDGADLVAFGSGTGESSCWILHLAGPESAFSPEESDASGSAPRFRNARSFYDMLQASEDFCGGQLNIEGAVALDEDRILILQRGNGAIKEKAVDATGELSWSRLKAYLDNPECAPPPPLTNVTRYDLGQLEGVRLTFSDAERLEDGRILYSASAEDPDTGDLAGSVLGLIEQSGAPRWGRIICEDNSPFKSKIEGLTITPGDPGKVRFVIDDDDDSSASEIFEAELSEAFGIHRGQGAGTSADED